jgi:hypothetical protein
MILNVIFVIVLHNFILNDSYLKTVEYYKKIEDLSEKAMEKSCNFSSECSLKLYAKNGLNITQTFEKTLNQQKVQKNSILESIKSPIKKLIAEADIKSIIGKRSDSNSCIITDLNNTIVCESDELVAVFKAESCQSCLDTFKVEFVNLEKRHYRSLIIKFSHKIHSFILKFFKSKNLNSQNFFDDKLKEKIEDLILN